MHESYNNVVAALKARLPGDQLDALGASCRFILRLRCICASAFVWGLVLSRFGQGKPGFTQARHWFQRLAGRRIWPRPFQIRCKSPAAVRLMHAAFDHAVEPWRNGTRATTHPLQRYFRDIVVWDSTPVALADPLRPFFKGLRNVASQVKIYLAISAFGALPLAARLTSGHVNDLRQPPPLELFRKGSLLLFDLGFVTYRLLREIQSAQLFYLCRMRRHGHATIVGVRAGPRDVVAALKRHPAGIQLRDFLPRDESIRSRWDLDVLVYPTRDKQPVRTRLVIVPGPNGEQRPYLTNLGAEWPPPALRELYRLRWQVELVFKELKQNLHLETVPTKDPHASQTLIWASLIALAVSRTVTTALLPPRTGAGLATRIRPAIVSRALRSCVHLLAAALTAPLRRALAFLRVLVDVVLDEARQSRKKRDSFARLRSLMPANA